MNVYALRAIGQYMALLPESQAGIDDEVVFQALKCVAVEPLANDTLHPLNWRTTKPKLDVFVSITPMRQLVVDVSPWPERMEGARLIAGIARDGVDFLRFPFLPDHPRFPRIRLIDLPLGEVHRYLDGDSGDPELDQRLVAQRRIVHGVAETALARLHQLFECRNREILVNFGERCFLSARRTGDPGEAAVRANLIGLDATGWHPRLAPLCQAFGITVEDALGFYRNHLAGLGERERLDVLHQYLKRPRHYAYPRRRHKGGVEPLALLQVLTVVSDPATYPPLIPSGQQPLADVLDQYIDAAAEAWWQPLAARYHLDGSQAVDLVREIDLARFDGLPHPLPLLRAEIDRMVDAGEQGSLRHKTYDRMLDARLDQHLQEMKARQVRKHLHKMRLAKVAGTASFAALAAWARAAAPLTAARLVEHFPDAAQR